MSERGEQAIKIVAKLYACRDTLVRVHGEQEYRRQIADPVLHLRKIAEARGEDTLTAALRIAKEAPRDTTRIWIFAAAVEAIEPLKDKAGVPA